MGDTIFVLYFKYRRELVIFLCHMNKKTTTYLIYQYIDFVYIIISHACVTHIYTYFCVFTFVLVMYLSIMMIKIVYKSTIPGQGSVYRFPHERLYGRD